MILTLGAATALVVAASDASFGVALANTASDASAGANIAVVVRADGHVVCVCACVCVRAYVCAWMRARVEAPR